MSSQSPMGFLHVCTFTYRDGRRCTSLRSPDHPLLCFSHARKELRQVRKENIGQDLCGEFKRNYLTACDLNWTLSRLFEALLF